MDRKYCEKYFDYARRYKFSLVHPLTIDLAKKSFGVNTRFAITDSLTVENMGLYQMIFNMGREYERGNTKSWEEGEEMGR